MPSEHCSDATRVNAEVAVHVKFLNVKKFIKKKKKTKKKNEGSCDTCISITLNPIQSDHNRQFTKLAKKKAEQKIYKLIAFLKHIPDETTHLTNKEVTFAIINEMSHVMNKDNQSSDKEREKNHHHHLKTQPTPQNLNRPCSSLEIA